MAARRSRAVTIDATPLLEVLARRRVPLDGHGQLLERAVHRAKISGRVTLRDADRLAVKLLGEHPAMVWGPAWWDFRSV